MVGAIVFAVVGYLASILVGKPLALAVAGSMAGVVWAAPHIPAAVGLGSWDHAAFALFLGVMAACASGLAALVRVLRPARELQLEVVEYDAAEDYSQASDYAGLERHFHPDRTGAPGMPGMWRGGILLVGGQFASDLAFTAGVISRGRDRWAARGRGPIETPQVGHAVRLGIGRPRHDDRRAA